MNTGNTGRWEGLGARPILFDEAERLEAENTRLKNRLKFLEKHTSDGRIKLQEEITRLKELNRELVAAMEMVVRNHSEVDWTLPIAIVLWIKTVLAKAEGRVE